MQTVVTVLISIAQVIGYIFLVIAGYYLILAREFTGEYAMGFGIGLVYGGTILFISSLVALFFKQYYTDKAMRYFKRVLLGVVGLFVLVVIFIFLS